MKVRIISIDGEWSAWASIDDDDECEPPDGYWFCVGKGDSPDEARAAAVRELESCLDELKQPSEGTP